MVHQPTPTRPLFPEVSPRFRAALAWEAMQARLERRPTCPLKPEATITLDGTVYAVEQREIGGFDSLSGKAKWTVTITSHDTGRSVEFGPCWWTQRRAKDGTVQQRYTSPAGKHGSWTDMVTALVALAAAQQASTLPLTNPVTGVVSVPVRIGGAA